jgi:hypothetical protein
VQLALLAIALSVPDVRGAERSSKGKGDVQAKLAYCEDCHLCIQKAHSRALRGLVGSGPQMPCIKIEPHAVYALGLLSISLIVPIRSFPLAAAAFRPDTHVQNI